GGSGANGGAKGGEGNGSSGGDEGPGLAGGRGGMLPRTGVEIGAAIFFGVAAIIGGSALVRMAKRRGMLPACTLPGDSPRRVSAPLVSPRLIADDAGRSQRSARHRPSCPQVALAD